MRLNFETSIKRELENKKYEYQSELLKWDLISSELLEMHHGQQIHQICEEKDFKLVDLLIRSMLRSEGQWESLSELVKLWMQDDYSKAMMEKNFSYELAMLSLTQLDYDRARIYIERESTELLNQWKNLTKLSQVAQHFLVQRIQKIYEMREFLTHIKDTSSADEHERAVQIDLVIKSMENWKQRVPSHTFDPMAVWDDIATSRLFFLDQYSLRFQNQPKLQARLSDIQVMLHIQTAKGAFKMGLYDSSDRYLKVAQSKRTHNHQKDMRITVPIIKLKTQ